jgi:glycerophosphoryl diester phosphodiesterase
VNYPRIIAHRCGGVLAAENTLAGLTAAAAIGCRGVEFDVMLSADGVPVLMHDDHLERTTTGAGLVVEHSLMDLRRVAVGDEPVPTLAEALDLCTRLGLWANIEIKPNQLGSVATAFAVGAVLARHWDGNGVVSSFAAEALTTLAARYPDCRRALLLDTLPTDWLTRTRQLAAVGLHCNVAALTATAISAAAAEGLVVAAYTVNERALADRWLAAGLSAVFSDRPDHWSPAEM